MNQNRPPHGSQLRKHRRKDRSGTFFVTKCLRYRKPLLLETGIAKTISESLIFSVENQRILLAAFVVMHDHWHALFYVKSPLTLPKFMKSTAGWIGTHHAAVLRNAGEEWQENYYDTRILTTRQFGYIIRYIEMNPVRKGDVDTKSEWEWSSAHERFRAYITKPWPWPFENDSPTR